MHNVFTTATSSSISTTWNNPDVSEHKEQDIWFDAIDWVDMDESWFDASDQFPYEHIIAEETADSLVPFTEDCRRCVSQLIRTLGDYKQRELLSVFIGKMLPGIPGNILMAADSISTAITKGENIDSAILHSLGLASLCLSDNVNMISWLATSIRKTLLSYIDDSFLQNFLSEEESHPSGYLFTALAITAIAARYWLTDHSAPQHPLLRIPAFMANLLLRANSYWSALGNMARNGLPLEKAAPHRPAFEVDTSVETAWDNNASKGCEMGFSPAKPAMTAFLSNSTTQSDALTKATVLNQAEMTVQENYNIAEKAHALATERLKQYSGLSDLLYCDTRKTETHQRQSGRVITNTHFNTRCDAMPSPAPIQKEVTHAQRHSARPEMPVSKPMNWNVENMLLPLMAFVGAGNIPAVRKGALQSGTFIAAAAIGLTGVAEGKALNSVIPAGQSPIIHPDKGEAYKADREHHFRPDSAPLISNLSIGQDYFLNKKAWAPLIDYLSAQGSLDESTTKHSITREELVAAVASHIFGQTTDDDAVYLCKTEQTARHILAVADLYGGKEGEAISLSQAESVISYWIYNALMGTSLNSYIARKTAADPEKFTISSIRELFLRPALEHNNRFTWENIPAKKQTDVFDMLVSYLHKSLPFLYPPENEINNISLDSLVFADFYTGSRYLAAAGHLHDYTQEEAIQIGRKMWDMAISDGVETDKISFYLLPSLLLITKNLPKTFSEKTNTFNNSYLVVNEYLEYRKNFQAAQQQLMKLIDNYKNAVNAWRTKGRLADNIIARCPSLPPAIMDFAEAIRTQQQRRDREMAAAKENYLNGISKPCRSAPDSLTDEYDRLTKNLVTHSAAIDELLIWSAFGIASKTDYDFMTSAEAIIRPVNFEMRQTEVKARFSMPSNPYSRDANIINPSDVAADLTPKQTDFFSVTKGNEERIYALHGVKDTQFSGYKLIQVNRDILQYIQSGIVKHVSFDNDFRLVINPRLETNDGTVFKYSIDTDMNTIINSDKNITQLVDFISKKHRDAIYSTLYASGNDKSQWQKTWDVAKHLIFLFDCLEGIINKDPDQAIPACLMDAIASLTVVGPAVGLSTRFAMGLARGGLLARHTLNVGGAAAKTIAVSAIMRQVALPTTRELVSLGVNALRMLDPGFELLASTGKKLNAKLVADLEKQGATDLAKKVASQALVEKMPSSQLYIVAQLPDSTISLPIKIVGVEGGRNVYALVSPDTGEAFGRRYLVENNNLYPLSTDLAESTIIKAAPPEFSRLSEELKSIITPDMYAENINVELLSAPNRMGLRYDYNNNAFIKIDNRYLKVTEKSDHSEQTARFEIQKGKKKLTLAFSEEMQIFYASPNEGIPTKNKFSPINVNCLRPRRALDNICSPSLVDNAAKPEFSLEQLNIIDRLRVPYETTRTYTQTRNLNPLFYGDGSVYDVRGAGSSSINSSPEMRVIEMNNQLIPIELNVIPGHGVVYYAWHKVTGESYPLACTGSQWHFEGPTDPRVSDMLEKTISSDLYEKLPNNRGFSAPDEVGLRWNAENNACIKVNNNYIRIYGTDDGGTNLFLRKENGEKQFIKLRVNSFYPVNADAPAAGGSGVKRQYEEEAHAGPSGLKRQKENVQTALSDIAALDQYVEDVFDIEAKPLFSPASTTEERQKAFELIYILKDQVRNRDLSNAHLNDIDFENCMDMTGFTLEKSQLQHAKMKNVVLSEVNLAGANMNNAVMEDAILTRANLYNALMIETDLSKANLDEAYLREANLQESKLGKASFNEADLRGADLTEANLNGASLGGAKLQEAVLTNIDAEAATFIFADLTGANLDDALLKYADLSNTKLTSASLDQTVLNNADLTEADLSKARLNGVQMVGAILTDAKLEGTQIDLKLPEHWAADEQDFLLNHLNNPESGSLLTMIDSIDSHYSVLKEKLAVQVVDSLRNSPGDFITVHEPLIDILSREPYRSNKKIAAYMETIYTDYLNKYNSAVIDNPLESIVNAALTFFSNKPSLMVSSQFNSAFMQTVHCAMAIPALRSQAKTLYNHYLEQEMLQSLLKHSEIRDNFGDYSGRPDWASVDAQNYILISPLNNARVMMLSPRDFTAMRFPDGNTQWNNFFLYQDGQPMVHGSYHLTETLNNDFPLFSEPYAYAAQSSSFKELLGTLGLTDAQYQQFVAATGRVTSQQKLVSPESQQQLSNVINKKIDFDKNSVPHLRQAHYDEILQTYKLSNASQEEKAKMMMSLSAVFSRYSSSAHFGTETHSPLAIRYYSSALLQKAWELSPAIFDTPEQVTLWNNKLLGRDGAFTCTAVLSDEMIRYAREHFPNISKAIIPPAWRS